MTTDHRPPTTGLQPLALRRSLLAALVALLLALAACGVAPGEPSAPEAQAGGGISPEAVTLSFFENLGRALEDPALADDAQRAVWVERLAGYFAPNERDDQRVALSDALTSLASGRDSLGANETMRLELRFDRNRAEKLLDDGQRAMVRLISPTIYIEITREVDGETITVRKREVGLEKLIGNADGAVPTVRIGRDWFLTEGQIGQ